MESKEISRAVCVLGMHRSGTSTITRAINLMGVYLGEELLPAADENPRGFWENAKILNLHERILESLETSWDDVHGIDPMIFKSHILAPYKEELVTLIHDEFGCSKLWGWKDPRTCLLLPLWTEALAELNIPVDFIIALRNPLEAAESLSKRNGFTKEKGLLLWFKYTLLAMKNSQGFPRVIVNYDNFLSNWQTEILKISSKFNIELPNDRDQFETNLNAFISPDLRHNKATRKEAAQTLPAPILKLYTALSDSVELDENKLNEEIYSISEISSLFSNYYDKEVSILQKRGESYEQTILSLNNENDSITHRFKSELEVMKNEKEDLAEKLNEVEQKLIEAEREKAALTEVISTIETSNSWRLTSPLRLAGRVGRKLVNGKRK